MYSTSEGSWIRGFSSVVTSVHRPWRRSWPDGSSWGLPFLNVSVEIAFSVTPVQNRFSSWTASCSIPLSGAVAEVPMNFTYCLFHGPNENGTARLMTAGKVALFLDKHCAEDGNLGFIVRGQTYKGFLKNASKKRPFLNRCADGYPSFYTSWIFFLDFIPC